MAPPAQPPTDGRSPGTDLDQLPWLTTAANLSARSPVSLIMMHENPALALGQDAGLGPSEPRLVAVPASTRSPVILGYRSTRHPGGGTWRPCGLPISAWWDTQAQGMVTAMCLKHPNHTRAGNAQAMDGGVSHASGSAGATSSSPVSAQAPKTTFRQRQFSDPAPPGGFHPQAQPAPKASRIHSMEGRPPGPAAMAITSKRTTGIGPRHCCCR